MYRLKNIYSREKKAIGEIIRAELIESEKKKRFKDIYWPFLSPLIAFVVGVFTTWSFSAYYHNKSTEQQKILLLDNAIFELDLNTNIEYYPEYVDTTRFMTAGHPFSYLQRESIDELYKKIHLFQESSYKDSLMNKLLRIKFNIEIFNDRVRLRNNSILIDIDGVKLSNPHAFEFYHENILPNINDLNNFIYKNKEYLID